METSLGEVRELLTKAIRSGKVTEVANRFPQIRIIEGPEDKPGEICTSYVFGNVPSHDDEIKRVIGSYQEVQDIKDGDIVIYFDNGYWTHVGKVKGGKVRSKWGRLQVVEHPVEFVPSTYGQPKVYRQ